MLHVNLCNFSLLWRLPASVRMLCSELPVLYMDFWIMMSARRLRSELVLRFGSGLSCSSWRRVLGESWENGHRPPPKGFCEKAERGQSRLQHAISGALWCGSLFFLCATLLCTVSEIILNLCDWMCKTLRTGSGGDALTPPTLEITMESRGKWATVAPSALHHKHMENYHRLVLQLRRPTGRHVRWRRLDEGWLKTHKVRVCLWTMKRWWQSKVV